MRNLLINFFIISITGIILTSFFFNRMNIMEEKHQNEIKELKYEQNQKIIDISLKYFESTDMMLEYRNQLRPYVIKDIMEAIEE